MTLPGMLTRGQKLVGEHTNRYAADAKAMEEDCLFLRYFREGLRRYLGPGSELAVEMEDCSHCFGEPYPVSFTIALSIGVPERRETFRLPLMARRLDDQSCAAYAVVSRTPGSGLGAFHMILATPDENDQAYERIIDCFQRQFGEKGKHALDIDRLTDIAPGGI